MALPLMGFHPNDHEKATYLLRKITADDDGKNANPATSDDLLYVKIPTTDVYGIKNPWELFDPVRYGREYYCFSTLKMITGTQNQPAVAVRSIGIGRWVPLTGLGSSHSICYPMGVPIGRIDRFKFVAQHPSDREKQKWVLEEISLIDSIAKPRPDEVRFCTLRRDMIVRDLRIQKSLDDMLPKTSSSSHALQKRKKHNESGPDGGKRLIIKG